MHEHANSLVRHSNDSRFLRFRSLQTAQGRARTGLYLVEGVRHVARAVEDRAPIESLFFSKPALSNPFGQKLLRKLKNSGIPCTQLSPDLYGQLTLAAEPQGLGAMVRQHWRPLQEARPDPRSFWLAIESIDSPGNLGTIIRTAEATGAAGIFVIGGFADPFDPAAVRASMGAVFSRTLVRCSAGEFAQWARTHRVSVIGSSPAGLLDYNGFRHRWPAALLIGSEKCGLSDHLTEACNFIVRIPMLGRGDSINAAVAAGVLLYEMFHQQRQP